MSGRRMRWAHGALPLFMALVSLGALGACEGDLATDPPLQVTMELQGTDTLAMLDTATVRVVLLDVDRREVRGPALTWTSSNESVLRVTTANDSVRYSVLLSGVSVGSADLSVSVADRSFSSEPVTHRVEVIPLGLEPNGGLSVAMSVGQLRTISVALRTADGEPTNAAAVAWTTNDVRAVTVVASEAGIGADGVAEALLAAQSIGTATVSVEVETAGGGETVQFVVTVSRDGWLEGLAVGEGADVAIVDVSGSAIDSIRWSAQDVTVLGVEEGGVTGTSLLGRRQGATRIVAQVSRSGFPRFSMEMPMQVVPVRVERVGWSDELKRGDAGTFQIRTLGFDSSAVAVPVRWAVSGAAVRIDSVSTDGLSAHVSGVSLGAAEVIVAVGASGLEEQELRILMPVRQKWAQVSVGGAHACAIEDRGAIYCWGANLNGQLGDGTTRSRAFPTPVATLLRYDEVAAGTQHTCARLGTAAVDCWGAYHYDQLGDGSGPCWQSPFSIVDDCFRTELFRTPTREIVGGDGPIIGGRRTLDAGATVSCYLSHIDVSPGSSLACFGDADPPDFGGAPDNGIIFGSLGVIGGAGDRHLCFVDLIGVRCTGMNDAGQLGDGTVGPPASQPTRVLTVDFEFLDEGAIAAAGAAHHCAYVNAQGPLGALTIWCWGSNSAGQLGPNAPVGLSALAVRVPTPERVRTLTLGSQHSCMLSDQGIAYCWGDNSDGQLGDGSVGGFRPDPAVAAQGIQFIDLSAGGSMTCGVATDRSLYCWGAGYAGRPVRVGEPVAN